MNNDDDASDAESDLNQGRGNNSRGDEFDPANDGIYRPPRLAPVPYTDRKDKKSRRAPLPSALSSLLHSDVTRPHIESTSGLGSTPSLASGRAAYLKRLNEFEEENFTRVMMKKRDAKRRVRDEEDIALGGSASVVGGGGKNRRRGGLEDEFSDVLRSVGRVGGGIGGGDGYEELRKKGRRGDVLERSRMRVEEGTRSREDAFGGEEEGGRMKKRSRFELATKMAKKKLARGRK